MEGGESCLGGVFFWHAWTEGEVAGPRQQAKPYPVIACLVIAGCTTNLLLCGRLDKIEGTSWKWGAKPSSGCTTPAYREGGGVVVEEAFCHDGTDGEAVGHRQRHS